MRMPAALVLTLALFAAGCVDTPEDLEAASAADASLAQAPTTEAPVKWEGSFPVGAYACPVVTCLGFQLTGVYQDLVVEGNLTGVAVTMTWEAISPTMEQLLLGIAWGEEDFEYVFGPSPLVLELEGLDIAPDEDPYLWAWTGSTDPVGLATVLVPQPFLVEGSLTQLAPAAEGAPAADAQRIAIDEEGNIGVMAVACTMGVCQGVGVTPTQRVFPQEVQGLVDVDVTLEWEPTAAATENLILGAFVCGRECGGDDEISRQEFVFGASPLTLRAKGIPVGEGQVLYLAVQEPGSSVAGTYAAATIPQSFALKGTLLAEA